VLSSIAAHAGVVIPLLYQQDLGNASSLVYSWDEAACFKWRRAGDIATVSLGIDQIGSKEMPGALGLVSAGAIRAGGLDRSNVELAATLLGRSAARKTTSGCVCKVNNIPPFA
jgi:hypothetical protein